MPAQRLYATDSYLTRFRARVVALREHQGKPAAVLDQTAFYPEGGGQAGDRGQLGTARVLDTQEVDGEVLHLLDRALDPDQAVDGEVDWAHRLDIMQQHHGQHLLSAAFLRVAQAATVSCHLGERTCTIDLELPFDRLGEAALREAERVANGAIFRNLPVVARDFVGEERAALSLRKEAVKGDRVVVVEGFDASPCGGTHPSRTGDVGAIAVLRAQKWGKQQTRVEFVCGGRVVSALAEGQRILAQAAGALGCAPAEVGLAAERVAAEALQLKREAVALVDEVASARAELLCQGSETGPLVASAQGGALPARALALALVSRGKLALISSVAAGRAHLCFARPRGDGPNLATCLREAVTLLGGKGGGSPELAQGSGEPARLAEAMARAREQLVSRKPL